jgi:aminopeptidase
MNIEGGSKTDKSNFQHLLDCYAEVIVKIGINLQPGQRLLIGPPFYGILGTPLEAAPLVRAVVKKAYQVGARYVEVLWNDDRIQLIRHQYAAPDSFDEFPVWRSEMELAFANRGDAQLTIYAENSGLLDGQDSDAVSRVIQAATKNRQPVVDLVNRRLFNRSLVAAPIQGWADKLFPHEPAENRKTCLWDAIFEMCRIKQENPVEAWKMHVDALKTRCQILDRMKFALIKLSGPGTDLTVGLPPGHVWGGGGLTTQNGIQFCPNLPTEEIFTLPHKDRVEGTVTSTMPLFIGGKLIEGIRLTFSQGRVVRAAADKGYRVLEGLLDTDEGARRLGELALVPYSSPISQSNLVFYNTLFDENASSHLALGRAYNFSYRHGEKLSNEEFSAVGGNISQIHVDFMIGSADLDVDGVTTNGVVYPIMRHGEWCNTLKL